MVDSEAIAILTQALESTHGISVLTSDSNRLKQRLYQVRKKNPEFESLSFRTSPFNPEGEVWIIFKPEEILDVPRT